MKQRSWYTILGLGMILLGSGIYVRWSWPAWEGARLAREDLFLGRARFLYCGELVPYEDEVVTRFAQRFRVTPYRWAGCVVDSWGYERAQAYNAVVCEAFDLSPDAFEQVVAQVVHEHR